MAEERKRSTFNVQRSMAEEENADLSAVVLTKVERRTPNVEWQKNASAHRPTFNVQWQKRRGKERRAEGRGSGGGSQARTLRQRWREPTLRLDGDVLGREAGHRIREFREAVSFCESA